MAKRRTRNESFQNLQAVVDGKNPASTAQMDVVMANAVHENAENEKQKDAVNDQLKDSAKSVTPDTKTPEEKPAVDNKFTAKLVLDEALEDFSMSSIGDGRSNKVYDDDEEDPHLDCDMFDFVYGCVVDCWPVPKDPFNRGRIRKFMYIGSDTYKDSDDGDAREKANGHAQVASFGDTIEVYHNDPTYFDDVAKIFDLYKIRYTGPHAKRNKNTYWNYSWRIEVPCVQSGYPYMIEDYFETIGYTIEDVMKDDFVKQYRKKQAALEKESQSYLNQSDVDKMVNKAITAAAQDNTEPLQVHLKRLYADLDAAGLKYQKSKVKKTFMDAFDDGDEEDE